MLLQHSDSPELSPEMDGLLRRLASFDTRSLYPRFGHNVLATCTYCQSFNDFAFYALPRPFLSYIREIAFIGVRVLCVRIFVCINECVAQLITLPSTPAVSLRKPTVAGLILLALGEAYTLATVAIIVPKRGSDERTIMVLIPPFFSLPQYANSSTVARQPPYSPAPRLPIPASPHTLLATPPHAPPDPHPIPLHSASSDLGFHTKDPVDGPRRNAPDTQPPPPLAPPAQVWPRREHASTYVPRACGEVVG